MSSESRAASILGKTALVAACGILLLFLPLICAFIEGVTLGSEHVENFFRTAGLHDFLTKVYDSMWSFLGRLIRF